MDQRLIAKVRRRDRAARVIITGGGILIIVSVLGILLLIAEVAVPLFLPARANVVSRFDLSPEIVAGQPLAVGMDEYLESAFVLSAQGVFSFFRATSGEPLLAVQVPAPAGGGATVLAAESDAALRFTLLWSDGSVTLEGVTFRPVFDAEGRRSIQSNVERLATFPAMPLRRGARRAVARLREDEGSTAAVLLADGRLHISQVAVEEDLLGDREVTVHDFFIEDAIPGQITALALDSQGAALYAGTDGGALLHWDLGEPGAAVLVETVQALADGRAVTALAMVQGDISLAVGGAGGSHKSWFPVPREDGPGKTLTPVHALTPHRSAVSAIVPNLSNKALMSMDAGGRLNYDYPTNERHLLALEPSTSPRALSVNTRGTGLIALDNDRGITVWALVVPHPEASFSAFFGRIWYEGFPQAGYFWQSSSASDDFEPKLSLIPLIFGTIKATFYGMLFAAPLAVLAAMYTSHLMSPRLHHIIKPTFEIMGSIPTVVVGFIAALWLAPLIRMSLGSFFVMLALVPAFILAAVFLWERLPVLNRMRDRVRGVEFLLLIPLIAAGVTLSFIAGQGLEALLFEGDLPLWLFQNWGVAFDQRNSIVIGFALGLAVIPIVFTLSDDALTNVPRNLTAASLALGASRWQTVWRVVLPSASPGVFAALMVGFGRAVGETMIVLMATGNTPILDWSVFNGMRTLAANIAVEIPEAPWKGTLYRTLFFSAVLLFLATFLLNTAAEFVRQRLRRKFGQY